MNSSSGIELEMALQSIQSSIHKNEKAKETLLQKQSSQVLITNQNLQALRIASSLITSLLKHTPFDAYSLEELAQAKKTLHLLNQRVENVFSKLKPGSSQHTLAVRRLQAHTLAIELIDEISHEK